MAATTRTFVPGMFTALTLAACGGAPSDEPADAGTGSAADDGPLDEGADDSPTDADEGSDDGVDDGPGTTGVDPPLGPTFAEHVAPILAANCWACHTAGGIAPFAMQDYEEVADLAPAIVAAIESRAMPPWPLDASGDCHDFVDARVLGDDEIATIVAWSDAGTPPGDLSLVPEPVPPASLDVVSATIAIDPYMPQGSPPENPYDDYRCFVIDSPSATGTVLTGFEVHPGVESQVHHIVAFGLNSDTAESAALAMAGADGRPGYTCFGGAGVPDASLLLGWAPGVKVGEYPEGTGVPVPAGRRIVLQMHYNLSAGADLDATSVDLRFDPAAIPLRSLVLFDTSIDIPAGSTDHVEGMSTVLDGNDAVIVAAFPHMHQIGKHLRVEAAAVGCAIDVPRWDFHWQQTYSYTEPLVIPGGTEVTLGCQYDATGRTETTNYGEGSSDEMCGVQFLALP